MSTHPFNPLNHITQISTKQGQKPFLPARAALMWFHDEFPAPSGRVVTEPISFDPIIFRAQIWIGDHLVATGHANLEGNSNSLRKVETAAIRRALSNAGFDTEDARARYQVAKIIQEHGSPRNLLNNSGGERRIGGDTPKLPPPPAPNTPTDRVPPWEDYPAQVISPDEQLAQTHDPANHWARNGGGLLTFNDLLREHYLLWNDVRCRLEPGKELKALTDTTLTLSAAIERLKAVDIELGAPFSRPSAVLNWTTAMITKHRAAKLNRALLSKMLEVPDLPHFGGTFAEATALVAEKVSAPLATSDSDSD
jgi:hypothetical protein